MVNGEKVNGKGVQAFKCSNVQVFKRSIVQSDVGAGLAPARSVWLVARGPVRRLITIRITSTVGF